MPAKTVIQLRRDTSTNWTTTNPTLASGEMGVELDTFKIKIGDGSTSWNLLPYASGSGLIELDGGNATSIYGGIPSVNAGTATG
jgi:hypothetical protein